MAELLSKQATCDGTELSDLNDDCLLEIFGYLNISELLAVSSLCTRFYLNGQRILPKKLASIDLSDCNCIGYLISKPCKLELMRGFFGRYGENITELTVDNADIENLTIHSTPEYKQMQRIIHENEKLNQFIDVVNEFCKSLTALTMTRITFFGCSKILKLSLTKLTLNFCNFDCGAYAICTLICDLPKLSSLTVSNELSSKCPLLVLVEIIPDSGFYFSINTDIRFVSGRLALLSELNLATEKFSDILPELIMELGSKNKLEILRLSGIRKNDEEVFQSILFCKQLRTLKIEPAWILTESKRELLFQSLPNLVHYQE